MVNLFENKICLCNKIYDSLGNHGLTCKYLSIQNKLRNKGHALFKYGLTQIIKEQFKKTDNFRLLIENTEPIISNLFNTRDNHIPDNNQRKSRGDIAFINTETGTIDVIDVTIADPTAKFYQQDNNIIGKAADLSEKRKQNNYNKIIDYNTIQINNLIIFAIETHGGLAKNANEFCRRLAKVSDNYNFQLHQIYTEINILIQNIRYNLHYLILHEFSKENNDINNNSNISDNNDKNCICNINSSQFIKEIVNNSNIINNSSITYIENISDHQITNTSNSHLEINKPVINKLTSKEIKYLYANHLLQNDPDYSEVYTNADEIVDIFDSCLFTTSKNYIDFINNLDVNISSQLYTPT